MHLHNVHKDFFFFFFCKYKSNISLKYLKISFVSLSARMHIITSHDNMYLQNINLIISIYYALLQY